MQNKSRDLANNLDKVINKDRNELERGCRVEYETHEGSFAKGRVWRIKDGKIAVNRDGYKQEIFFDKEHLKNLSASPYGLLEKQIWLMNDEIFKLKSHINTCNLDPFANHLNINKPKETLKISLLYKRIIEETLAYEITYKVNNSDFNIQVISADPVVIAMNIGTYTLYYFNGSLIKITKIK